MKKIVIAGGTGFLGSCLKDYYAATDTHLVILTRGISRTEGNVSYVQWDGKSTGKWCHEIEGADALPGKESVFHYTNTGDGNSTIAIKRSGMFTATGPWIFE